MTTKSCGGHRLAEKISTSTLACLKYSKKMFQKNKDCQMNKKLKARGETIEDHQGKQDHNFDNKLVSREILQRHLTFSQYYKTHYEGSKGPSPGEKSIYTKKHKTKKPTLEED
jgi:hypothetical protein